MAEPPSAPGPGGDEYLGTGSLDRLLRSFADDGQFMLVALRNDGTVAYASRGLEYVLGLTPENLLGRNVLELLHPDDVERASIQLSQGQDVGIVPGMAKFLATHGDGSWMPVEALASHVTDGAERFIGVYARRGLYDVLLEELLTMLLTGAPRPDSLAPITNSIQWEESGSQIAISWQDDTGFNQVSSGLPDSLAGGDGEPGTPWAEVRETGVARRGGRSELGERAAAAAAERDLELFWIEPVEWSESWPPATVTILTPAGRETVVHEYGMGVATNLVTLILRWTEQVEQLERAAQRDPLTGLANRRAFFDALSLAKSGGAVLYCDLDGFKPVNDEFGHSVGDQVLQLAAIRLQACVRAEDVVGRLGGDEFGILCEAASEDEANAISERIAASLSEPFRIGDTEVRIGVSVGMAANPQEMTEQLLDAADRNLVQLKSGRRDRRRQD